MYAIACLAIAYLDTHAASGCCQGILPLVTSRCTVKDDIAMHAISSRSSSLRPVAVPADTSIKLEPESLLPLTPTTFHILIALADADRHGYAIMQAIADRTDGRIRIGAGTLYGSLKRLVGDGLLEERELVATGGAEERRRYYRLTTFGRAVARAEARRLEDAVRLARGVRILKPLTG